MRQRLTTTVVARGGGHGCPATSVHMVDRSSMELPLWPSCLPALRSMIGGRPPLKEGRAHIQQLDTTSRPPRGKRGSDHRASIIDQGSLHCFGQEPDWHTVTADSTQRSPTPVTRPPRTSAPGSVLILQSSSSPAVLQVLGLVHQTLQPPSYISLAQRLYHRSLLRHTGAHPRLSAHTTPTSLLHDERM